MQNEHFLTAFKNRISIIEKSYVQLNNKTLFIKNDNVIL